MSGIGIGSVCYKTTGRRAGKEVIIVGREKSTGRAIVLGEAKTVRACNVQHLWPKGEKKEVTTVYSSVPKKEAKEKKKQKKHAKKQTAEKNKVKK